MTASVDDGVVRWGALSTGRITSTVVAAARNTSNAVFVAVASRDLERARAHASVYGTPLAYGSYEDLLRDESVHAVYIGLPNSLHLDWARRALERGKHVLCEKPLGRSAVDVQRAFRVAEDSGCLLAEAFMYRYHPQTARLLELVQEGAIGALAQVNATMTFALEGADDPRTSPELDGGALMDLGCYGISAARLLAGEPECVYGDQTTGQTGVDDRFVGMLRFANGVRAQFDVAMDLPRRDRLEVVGTDATIVLADPWHCRARSFPLHLDGEAREVQVDPVGRWGLQYAFEDTYRLQLQAFSRAVLDGTSLPFGETDAVGQARTIEALHRAAEFQEPVSLVAPIGP